MGSGASHHRGLADQPPKESASAIELGEQSRACPLGCALTFLPGGSCETAATALADSVPSGPAWSLYARQAAEFHVKRACLINWASATAGEDLAAQIAPGFTLGRTPSRRPSRERAPESARR